MAEFARRELIILFVSVCAGGFAGSLFSGDILLRLGVTVGVIILTDTILSRLVGLRDI